MTGCAAEYDTEAVNAKIAEILHLFDEEEDALAEEEEEPETDEDGDDGNFHGPRPFVAGLN